VFSGCLGPAFNSVELLCELHRAQEAGINMHASIIKAHHYRADLRSKIADYPEIDDYVVSTKTLSPLNSEAIVFKSALQDYDEHQVLLLHQNIRDLRNIYIVLCDLVKPVIG